MKLFLIGLGHMRREQIDVARALQENHEIQYWVRMRGVFSIDENEFPGTIFHEYLDALRALPAQGIDANAYDPWGVDDIAVYASAESEFMTMADKWYPDWSVNHRKELYYEMLRYWGGVLEMYKPDCIIIPVIPHEMYSFVIYSIARRRGIKTIILDAVLENDHYIAIEDYKQGNAKLATALEAQDRTITISDLSPDMQKYYQRVSNEKNPAPVFMRSFMRTQNPWHSFIRWLKAIRKFIHDGTIVERASRKVFKIFKSDLKDEYTTYERAVDFEKPYIYFPLHYQPEATTAPQGGIFSDQLLAIRIAASALPQEWELYVKEHPAQLAVHGGNTTPARYHDFYKAIAEIPNVRLIPIQTNTFELTDHAKATATITGTAGWESILRKKAAIIFGYPWFLHAPGIIRVTSVEECRKGFEKIATGWTPAEKDILKYLYVLDHIARWGYLQYMTPGFEDQWPHMVEAIEEMLASNV